MSDTSRIDIVTVDLAKPLQREKYGTLLATGDENANRFGANIVRNGAEVDVTGYTVSGSFIRPDGVTVPLEGVAEGNTAYIDLASACYISEGTFTLSLKIISEGFVHTVRMIDGYIRRTASGAFVASDETIISIEQIEGFAAEVAETQKKASVLLTEMGDAVSDTRKATQELSAVTAPPITPDTTGDGIITATDSAHRPLQGLTLYGKTTQDGTPTPDAPVPLVSVGDGSSITASVKGKNLLPASSAGTYTKSGITFTSYGDGRYHLSGTAETTVYYDFRLKESVTLPVKCPLTIANNNSVQSTDKAEVAYIGGGVQHGYLAFNDVNRVITYEDGGSYSGKLIDTMRLMVVAGTTIECDVAPNIMVKTEDVGFEPYKDGGSVTVSTPNGLPGIPVTSGGNYTDGTGQQWICDEVDFGRGVYVQRINRYAFTGTEEFVVYDNGKLVGKAFSSLGIPDCKANINSTFHNVSAVLCNVAQIRTQNQLTAGTERGIAVSRWNTTTAHLYFDVATYGGVEEIAASMTEAYSNGIPWVILYEMETPIETALTAEELTAYAAMTSQYPNTTVYNDAGAGMAVSYIADTKNYIDQRIAALLNA